MEGPSKPEDKGSRDEAGRFKLGGPPGPGRPRIDPEVREMLRAATPTAAKRLIEALDAMMVVHYLGDEVGTYVDHDKRLRAAEAILNRLYGKPNQALTGDDGGPIKVEGALLDMLRRLDK